MRILLGLVTCYSLLSAVAGNVIDMSWVGREYGGMLARESGHWLWLLLDGPRSSDGTTPANVWALVCVCGLCAVVSTLGLGGRWPLLATQQSYLALISLNGYASGGYDVLITNAWLLLFFSGSTATLSLDCRIQHGRWSRRVLIPAWPRYLLLTQLLVMYSATGFQKVGLSWTPMGGYTALHYILHDPTWTRFAPDWVSAMAPALRVATALSWHWEQLSLLMLLVVYLRLTAGRPGRLRAWVNRWDLRLPWALTGIGMHLGILALLNVGPFSLVSLSYYVTLWSGGELDRLMAKLRTRWQPRASKLPEPS